MYCSTVRPIIRVRSPKKHIVPSRYVAVTSEFKNMNALEPNLKYIS